MALEEGFHAVGFAKPEISPSAQREFTAFIDAGLHGEMDWLAKRSDERKNPKLLMPEVKTIVCLGINYGPERNPLEVLNKPDIGAISVYAQGDDYHDVVKKMLKSLAAKIHKRFPTDMKVFVDTAPILEKVLASQTQLGWQGKHTCIVSREFGSWLFLGEIFLSIDIEPDIPHSNSCGKCTACIDICPTQAISKDGKINPTRCISYLTIEHKGDIPEEFHAAIGNRIYGCDDCLAVCPWNKFAKLASEQKLQARIELQEPSLDYLASINEAEFRELFRKNPIKRIGYTRFMRNVGVAIKNRDAEKQNNDNNL